MASQPKRTSIKRVVNPKHAPRVVPRDPKVGPPILFPTEPSTIGFEKIWAAVGAVKAKAKKTS